MNLDAGAADKQGKEPTRCPFHEGGEALDTARLIVLATDLSRVGIQLAGALVPHIPRDPASVLAPSIANYAGDAPRPGLRALRHWLAEHAVRENSGMRAWGELTFDEQLVGRTRLRSHEHLKVLTAKLWESLKSPLERGCLPLPPSILRLMARGDGDRLERVGNSHFLMVPSDELLAKRLSIKSFEHLATFFRGQLNPFYAAAVTALARDPQVADQCHRVNEVLQFREDSAVSVLVKGLSCGTNMVVSTLELLFTLAQKHAATSGTPLTEAQIQTLVSDNQALVFELTQISFLALVKLRRITSEPGTEEMRHFQRQMTAELMGEDPEDLPEEILIPSEGLNPKYFCLREYVKPGHSQASLLLDFDLSAFSPTDWQQLASVGPILGCSAGAVNGEFIPLMSKLFARAALPFVKSIVT